MRFIVIDGLDGAGKDTHAHLIVKKYASRGERVLFRSHPENDNTYGLKAKEALLGKGKINHIRAAIYYALDIIRSLRRYHNEEVDTLVFSRYLLGVAYLPYPLAKILYIILSLVLPTTAYLFFLDVEAEESMRRLAKRDEQEMFENLDDLIKTREKALHLVKNWHIINTCGSIGDVQSSIDQILNELDKQDPNDL